MPAGFPEFLLIDFLDPGVEGHHSFTVSSGDAGAGGAGAGADMSSAGAEMSSVISSLPSENIESETEEVSDFVGWTRSLGILLTEWCST